MEYAFRIGTNFLRDFAQDIAAHSGQVQDRLASLATVRNPANVQRAKAAGEALLSASPRLPLLLDLHREDDHG
jgi:hypothetical protein